MHHIIKALLAALIGALLVVGIAALAPDNRGHVVERVPAPMEEAPSLWDWEVKHIDADKVFYKKNGVWYLRSNTQLEDRKAQPFEIKAYNLN